MIGKSNIADCDETCKYKEVYQIYKAAYNSAWNEFSFQTGIIMVLLSFVIVTDTVMSVSFILKSVSRRIKVF